MLRTVQTVVSGNYAPIAEVKMESAPASVNWPIIERNARYVRAMRFCSRRESKIDPGDYRQTVALLTLTEAKTDISTLCNRAYAICAEESRTTIPSPKRTRKGKRRQFKPDRDRSTYYGRSIVDCALRFDPPDLGKNESIAYNTLLNGGDAHSVASACGCTRNAADRIIRRLMLKLVTSTWREEVAEEFTRCERERRITISEFKSTL